LTDINGDGRADLVFPASGMLFVAYNGGQDRFYTPVPYYAGAIPDPRFIRFGRINADALADMLVWTPDMAQPQIYLSNGVRFVAPPASPVVPLSNPVATRLAAELPTFQLADINGDGLDDLVLRGNSQVQCAVNTGRGFLPLTPCSTPGGQFTNSQGWSMPAVASTFAVAHINGPAVVGGLPTGVIFAPVADAKVSDRYRFLCNDCFTNSSNPAWKPDLRASQIVWGDFGGTGIDSPCFVRRDGLYLGLTQILK
jgi:hypothetical protein